LIVFGFELKHVDDDDAETNDPNNLTEATSSVDLNLKF
jgi:hypothetical protein